MAFLVSYFFLEFSCFCLLFLLFFSLSSHCNYLLEFISWWCVESVQTLYLTICKYLRQQPSTTDKLPVNKRRNEDILSQTFHHIASNSAIANSYSSLWLWDKLLTQPLSFQLFTLFFSFVTAFAISYFCTFVCVLVFIWYMCIWYNHWRLMLAGSCHGPLICKNTSVQKMSNKMK